MFFKWWQWLPGLYRYTFSFMVEQLSNISQLSSTLVPSVAISTFWTVPCLRKTIRVTYQLVGFHSYRNLRVRPPPPQEIAGLIQDSLRGLWWVHGPLIRPYSLGGGDMGGLLLRFPFIHCIKESTWIKDLAVQARQWSCPSSSRRPARFFVPSISTLR